MHGKPGFISVEIDPFFSRDLSNAFNYNNNSKTMAKELGAVEITICYVITGSGQVLVLQEIIRVDFSLFTPLSRLQFTSDCFYCGCPQAGCTV